MTNLFDNYSPAMLADELGETKAQIRGLELRKDALEAELARRGVVRCLGERWHAKRSKFDRLDPDRAKLKAELGDRYEVEFCKAVPITRWSCAAVELKAA